MSRPTLHQLYAAHTGKASDRWSSYLTEYDRLFDAYRDKPVRLFEIGVQNGGSLEIWSKYFANAATLMGCDVNGECGHLSFDDPRISVVVGDANTNETADRVLERCKQFDIIVDDGSHQATDIVRSFVHYFPHLADNGLFIVEDLHCSYWQDYEGGLFQPYSPMAFFKKLADIVSHEHWGVPTSRQTLLAGVINNFGISIDEAELAHVHSVEFINSLCCIRRSDSTSNQLGRRVVGGQLEPIVGVVHLHNELCIAPSQATNRWSSVVVPRDEELRQLEQQIRVGETAIANINRALVVRDEKITALNEAMLNRENQVDELSREASRRDKEIVGLNESISDRDRQIQDLNGLVFERNQRINEISQAGFLRDQKVAELEVQIRRLETSVAGLLGSTSWRLSAPVRFVGRQLLRIRALSRALHYARTSNEGGGYLGAVRQVLADYKDYGVGGVRQRIVSWALADAAPATSSNTEPDRNDYVEWVRRFDTLDDSGRARIKARIGELRDTPLISIVMPVYNPPLPMLEAAIQSVQRQLYPHWELCIADDASTDRAVGRLLRKAAERNPRIKVRFRERNGHISAATNSAIEIASGDFIAFLDNDDLLSEHALFWIAQAIADQPDVGLLYSDEDKIDELGKRYGPYFKSDWNLDLFLSHNMICHLGVYRAELVRELGGLREGYEGAQDYDLALRCTERLSPQEICHVPRILYHWRSHPGSTAKGGNEKPYALQAGLRALNDHFARVGVCARAELLDFEMYRVRYAVSQPAPLVSLIIPTRNGLHLLKQCVESILDRTSYTNYEMLIVDNGSDDPETLAYLQTLKADPRIRVLRDERAFNFSALNNAAVLHAHGEYLGLINNDIEVISPEWLDELVSLAQQPGVGAVGARLWYPNGTLQHGGVICGIGRVAGHSQKYLKRGDPGYFGRAQLIQTMSAVTAACLVIRKCIYEEVGGLDEVNLKVAFNDVDFCLRVGDAGYRNVWTPYAELIHHESASRGDENSPEKQKRFLHEVDYMTQRWGTKLLNDPAYSPNLTLEHEDFSLAWPPRVEFSAG